MTRNDILQLVGVVVATVAMIVVMRWRRRSHQEFIEGFVDEEICEHLRPAMDALLSRGHKVRRAGQRNPHLPLEVHITPAFDPKSLLEELKLQPPVHLSERNVLYCKEDACELHPEQ